LKTRALACCDFHQSVVDNFIATVRVMNLPSVYPHHFTGDRSPQRTCAQSASCWHGDCLNKSAEWLARRPSDEVTYDSPTGSLLLRNLLADRLLPHPSRHCATSVAGRPGEA